MPATLDDVAKKKEPAVEPPELQAARELVRQREWSRLHQPLEGCLGFITP
jgi:hypothetical protein